VEHAPASDAASAEAAAALRAELAQARGALRSALISGARGGAAAAAMSDVYDRALATRWRFATRDVTAPLALVATGGWARRELAPYSDIDFVLLHRGDEVAAKLVADRLLYPLWDAKVAVGHAVREPRAAARLAKGDLPTATALVDVRHITGERALTDELCAVTRSVIAPGGDANEFIAQLAVEKARRHERFGDSLYLLEPNLKQGIGALRDLATALWAARARWLLRAGPLPSHGESIALLRDRGHLTRRQGEVLAEARDFLLGLRALAQLVTGRRTDQLTFEMQEALGPALYPGVRRGEGTGRPAVAPAVEALMRAYYLHARSVVQVADRLLETARVPPRKKPRIREIDSSFLTFNGELAVREPKVFSDKPSELLRLFRVAVAEDTPVYGHTRDLVAEMSTQHAERLRADPAAARWFVDALCDPRDQRQPSQLEILNQLGVIAAVMPEWAPVVCRVQHDLYHVYTVDQHQLYAVAMLKRIARGELHAEFPTATEAYARVTRPASMYLGTLLHDVGKPLGKGHAEKGGVIAGVVGARLGLAAEDVATAEFLVRQHLTMSHLSQRRDLSDPEVVARFAERVGDEERLAQLYLLTLCDAAMTAPNNLSAWKAELLRDLYLRARALLSSNGAGAAAAVAADVAERRAKVVGLVAPDAADRAAIEAVVAGLDERCFAQLTQRQAARHVRLALAVQARGARVGVAVSHFPLKGHSEVAVVAPDTHGVLAAIAGALVAHRVDVLGAVVGRAVTPAGPVALDLFFVRDGVGAAIPDSDARWARMEADLVELLASGGTDHAEVTGLIARRRPPSGLPPRVTPAVATDIRVDNHESSDATIVEVFTRDRLGVLHAITQTLADLGLDISLSKVSTEGEKAADVFYVTRDGAKVTDPAAVDAVCAGLATALAGLP
jgi:[protein-PII] uridylyltransferase